MIAPETVIVVDDDPSVRSALDSLLRSVKLRTLTFGSVEEFLAERLPEGPGCLILDVRMPGMSGLDLQSRLADQGVCLPIIFITGHGDIPMSVRAVKAGALEFLEKPFRQQDLLDGIRRALEKSRLQVRAIVESEVLHKKLCFSHAAGEASDVLCDPGSSQQADCR